MSILLALGFAGYVLLGLGDGAVGVAFPSLRAAFRLGAGGIGWVLAGTASGYFVAGFLAGAVGRRIGIGRLLLAGGLLVVAGLACEGVSPVLAALIFGALLFGLGGGCMDAGLNVWVADHRGARHLNWLHGFYGVGTTIGPVLMTGLLLRGESWRWGYAALAGAGLCVAASFGLTRRRWTVSALRSAAEPGSWLAAVNHPLVRLQVVLFFIYTGLEVTLGQWTFSVFLARGSSAAAAGAWTTAYWGCFTASRFVLGALIGRLDADRVLRAATCGVVAGAGAYAGAPQPWDGLGLVLAGVCLAPIYPTLIARAPERLGSAIALHAIGFKSSAATAGAASLPALAGLIAARSGLRAVGWVALAAAFALLALHERLIARASAHERHVRAAAAGS